MNDVAQLTARTRSAAAVLVERAERATGSRMAAYEMVAQTVGASAEWLRKFVGRSAEVKEPRWTVGLNILAAYDRLCTRIEAEQQTERALIAALKADIDAASPGALGMVATATGTQAIGMDGGEEE